MLNKIKIVRLIHTINKPPQQLKKGLYIIATPIGNLQDISYRAIDVLSRVNLVLCENILNSKKLFKEYSINPKQLSSLNLNNETNIDKLNNVINLIENGDTIGLISDAGTPLVSDPGFELVKLVRERNLPVYSIPGPCSLVAALSTSGLSTAEFSFLGFIPQKGNERKTRLSMLNSYHSTLIFYEAPHRLVKTLKDLIKYLGDGRNIHVAKEITKIHEGYYSGTLLEMLNLFEEKEKTESIKGEFVLILSGKKRVLENEGNKILEENEEANRILYSLIDEKVSISTAVKVVAKTFPKIKKTLIYDNALNYKK